MSVSIYLLFMHDIEWPEKTVKATDKYKLNAKSIYKSWYEVLWCGNQCCWSHSSLCNQMQFFNQANEVGLKREATIFMGSQEVQSIQIIKTWKI